MQTSIKRTQWSVTLSREKLIAKRSTSFFCISRSLGAGGFLTGSNPGYAPLELKDHLEATHARYIIGEPALLSTILETTWDYNTPTSHIFVFDAFDKVPNKGLCSWEVLLQHGGSDWVRFKSLQEERTPIVSPRFTTGSTGNHRLL